MGASPMENAKNAPPGLLARSGVGLRNQVHNFVAGSRINIHMSVTHLLIAVQWRNTGELRRVFATDVVNMLVARAAT